MKTRKPIPPTETHVWLIIVGLQECGESKQGESLVKVTSKQGDPRLPESENVVLIVTRTQSIGLRLGDGIRCVMSQFERTM